MNDPQRKDLSNIATLVDKRKKRKQKMSVEASSSTLFHVMDINITKLDWHELLVLVLKSMESRVDGIDILALCSKMSLKVELLF